MQKDMDMPKELLPTYEISFYKDFTCRAGRCEETCCRGWKVSVDDEALKKYKSLHSVTGLRIRLAMLGREDGCFDTSYRACPFFNKEGLCGIQLKYGEDYIPEICRTYPRLNRNYGFMQEKWLDLSCIEAAELFLSRGSGFCMTAIEAEEAYESEYSNDDRDFLRELIKSRQEIVRYLDESLFSKREDLDRAFQTLLSFGLAAEQGSIKNDHSYFQKKTADFYRGDGGKILFPFPMELFQEMICVNGFYHRSLFRQLPFLNKILQLFLSEFKDIGTSEGQEKWERLYNSYLEMDARREDMAKGPRPNGQGILRELVNYYSYSVWTDYLRSFEDYSFSKWLLRGMLAVNFFFLFSALLWQEQGDISRHEKAHVMSVLERRMHHNPTQEKKLMESLRKYVRK